VTMVFIFYDWKNTNNEKSNPAKRSSYAAR